MIPYFPRLENGELVCSAIARAAALLFRGASVKMLAKYFLGHPDRAFGGLLPSNGALLLSHLPAAARLSEPDLVHGSIYPLLAPFLTEHDRRRLWDTILVSSGKGNRNWVDAATLRYCPLCARQDIDDDRPQYWRVLHNHPFVASCATHHVRLVDSDARLGRRSLYDPAVWQTLDAPCRACTDFDSAVATDADWLLTEAPKALPDREDLIRAATDIVRRAPGVALGTRRVHWDRVRSLAQERLRGAHMELTELLHSLGPMSLRRVTAAQGLSLYSLLAQLGGRTLSDLVTIAVGHGTAFVTHHRPPAEAPEWGKTTADAPVRPTVDDAALDTVWCGAVLHTRGDARSRSCRTTREILSAAGLSIRRYERCRASFPLTRAAVRETRETIRADAMVTRALRNLKALLFSCPNLTRKEFDARDRHAAEVLRKYARATYDTWLPSRRRRKPH